MRSGIPLPKLYDFDMKPIGRLHPTKAGYDLKLTPLSTCTLELAGESVKDGQFVELYDAFGDVGVFRAYEVARTRGTKEQEQVKLEHAFATLGDTVIPGYFEFGGVGTTTRSVLAQLLAKQRRVASSDTKVVYSSSRNITLELTAPGGGLSGCVMTRINAWLLAEL